MLPVHHVLTCSAWKVMVAMLTAVPCLALLTDWSTLLKKTEELLPLALHTKALCQSVPREQLLWEGTASRLESKLTCTCSDPQQSEGMVAPVACAQSARDRSCQSTCMQTALQGAGFGTYQGGWAEVRTPMTNGRLTIGGLISCRLSASSKCWSTECTGLCSAALR